MIVLAVDAAGEACSAALLRDGQPLARVGEPMARGHQERLAPLVRDLAAGAGVTFPEIGRIAATTGPGSFTGLRVGLAFARAMALALDVPCVGVSRLEALAAGIDGPPDAPRLAAVDGRRGQLYLQAFRGGAPLAPPAALDLEGARAVVAGLGPGVLIAGSGAAALLGERFDGPIEVDPIILARLAAAKDPAASPPNPLYLRAPEARTLAERGRPEPCAPA